MTILILGRRELGKSTLARFMARRCDRRVIEDPRHMFPADDPIGDLPDDAEALEARLFDNVTAGEPFDEIVIQPGRNLERTNADLADVLEAAYPSMTGKLAIVLDDASLINFDPWAVFFRTAPRDRVYLIVTAHRPQDIPTWVRAIADYWCLFKMTQEHDLKMIESQCGADVAAKVSALPPLHFYLWDDATADETKRLTYFDHPEAWHVPMRDRALAGGGGAALVEP